MAWFLENRQFDPGYGGQRAKEPRVTPLTVHARLPGYGPTPLHRWPALAHDLGLAEVWVKDESSRLGLPAYKVLGASWATYRVLSGILGRAPEPWRDLTELRALLAAERPRLLVTASDGNHGRGVARVAHWLGWPAEIYLPRGTAAARLEAIAGEGATVVEVDGTYDDAVACAAERAGAEHLLIQDHGWEGYEEIPGWVAEGYETIFAEVDAQLAALHEAPPTLVLVQIGVGTLATAVVRHYRGTGKRRAMLVGVEPTGAACAFRSVEAGQRVMLEAGAHASIMAGLNCGTPSLAAWPSLLHGVAGYVAVDDDAARHAMRRYRDLGVAAGESGAAGLAGLSALASPSGIDLRRALGIGASTRALLLVTEGVTDPVSYRRIVGHDAGPVLRSTP